MRAKALHALDILANPDDADDAESGCRYTLVYALCTGTFLLFVACTNPKLVTDAVNQTICAFGLIAANALALPWRAWFGSVRLPKQDQGRRAWDEGVLFSVCPLFGIRNQLLR